MKLKIGQHAFGCSLGADVLNALACFCEVSHDLRYSLQKLCYSKVDFEMQEILPIFGLFDRKAVGCIDLEDFTISLLDLAAEITAPQCADLFNRLTGCFEEKNGSSSVKRNSLQYSEFMAAILPVIAMPSFVQTMTDVHGIGLSVLDIESDLRAAFNLERMEKWLKCREPGLISSYTFHVAPSVQSARPCANLRPARS